MDAEKLELTAELKNIKKQEDGTYHPADLMAHKIQIHMEHENRNALTFLDKEDTKLDMLFKHYESLLAYQHAFEELTNRATEYRQNEEHEGGWAIKGEELKGIQTNLDEIH